MKQYSHDYTKVSEAERALYAAQQLNAHDDTIESWKRIEDARLLLQEYLAQDNMVEDNDVADGWVRASDVEELEKGKEDEYDPLTRHCVNSTHAALYVEETCCDHPELPWCDDCPRYIKEEGICDMEI